MKEFVKNHFNKSAFKDVTFTEFKKIYIGKLGRHDITEVAKELGIDTVERKKKTEKKEK